MTDSVGSSSVHLSSDTDVDPCCEPCGKRGSPIKPVGYCPKCVEFFCQICLEAHSRLGITARHKIQTGDDMPKSLADKPVKYQICEIHDGKPKDRFCFDHRIIVCGIGSLRNHKECDVKLVTEAHKMFNLSAQRKAFCYDVDVLINYANIAKKSVGDNINKLETDSKSILKEAENYRNKLIKHINESYHNLNADVIKEVKEPIDFLSASQLSFDQIVSDLNSTLQSLQQSVTKKENVLKQFLDFQAHAEIVRLCQDKIKKIDMSILDIEYKPNNDIQPLVDSCYKFGYVSIQSKPFHCETTFPELQYPYSRSIQDQFRKEEERLGAVTGCRSILENLTSLGKMDVKMKDDTEDCFINGIDMTVDGKILLTDFDNCKIKLYSTAGQSLCYFKLPAKPTDVTVFNGSEAAVNMQHKQIGIINIADTDSLSMKHIINSEYFLWALTAYKNNLIITCDESANWPRSVQMIDRTGNLVWTVTRDIDRSNIFDCAMHLTTRSSKHGDSVIVTDFHKNTITVLDAGSGTLRKVIDVKCRGPRGITVDGKGNIYICYRNTGEITVWSRNMEEERSLVSRSEELYYPFTLACDQNRQELFVSNCTANPKHSRFIYRFKIRVA